MSTTPNQVLIIRHGEKLGSPSNDNDGGPDLSMRGSARAGALPQLFMPQNTNMSCSVSPGGKQAFTGTYVEIDGQGPAPRFATPDFIFATQASKSSNRPVETITPTAESLNLAIDSKHADGDYAKVAQDILSNSKYAGKVVLICWHHGKIPDLAEKLGITNPPAWPGTVFDRVWVITFPSGAATLANDPQMLLYGDSAQ